MKFRHFITSLAVTAVGAFGVLAGLSQKSEAKVAKADTGDTWMFTAFLNTATIPESYKSDCSNFRFHVWGTNVDEFFTMHETGSDDVYTVNCSFNDDQTVIGGQFVFEQSGEGLKYSKDISFGYDKNSDFFGQMSWTFDEDYWSDGKWKALDQKWMRNTVYYYDTDGNSQNTEFSIDPVNNRLILQNLVINETNLGKSVDVLIRGYWADGYNCIYNTDLTNGGSAGWFKFKEVGTYDLIIENECKDDGAGHKGIIEIKKHEAANNTFIYYVTNSASATTDYIYSWGGSEQFGSFPGTSIASLVAADKAKEVTGNGVLHFQGGDDSKLIYRIDITIGYPTGDSMFMFNNGTDSYKSAERAIAAEHAYWWTGDANHNAAHGLDFLITAEAYRNGADDHSVCNISDVNASVIVGLYNVLDKDVRETYVDSSKVYTYKVDPDARQPGDENELVSYRKVMEQLGEIAGVAVVGQELTRFDNVLGSTDSSVVLIIVAASLVSAAGLVTLLVIRKRKHQ